LKAESVAVVVLTIAVFLSFYFTFLSFQAVDETLKRQMITFAAYSLITGVVILATLMVHLGIKKAFSRIGEQLKGSKESSET